MASRMENFNRVHQLEAELTQVRLENWLNYEVFSPQWWVLLGILVLPWTIWVKFIMKSKVFETLLFGAFTIITAASLDAVGEDLSFWGYPFELTPVGHNAFPFNFGLVPIGFMIVHQYCPTWKSFCIGLLILSILYSFIGEPLMQMMGVYVLMKWKLIYSFLYYIMNGLVIRALIVKLYSKQTASSY